MMKLPWLLGAPLLAAVWAVLPATVRLGPEVTPELPVEAGLLVPEYGADGTYGLHYRHHETVTVTLPVRNRGLLPLTVEQVSLDSQPEPLLVPVEDNLPVRIEPRSEGDVTLTLRFDNCRHYHERSADTWDRLAVEGSVLGRDFDTDVDLAFVLALHGQVINDCPDRTLTRGDDQRDE